jgi:glycyl-tRNA synthetase
MSTDAVTMDKIVSLTRRRGFVFPSSEIYGGLGSTYDYGHYGVLTKNNIRSRWFTSMVQERDDIVALDSAVILNPLVWEASGHVEGFTDPLVDCRTCKLRFRGDRLEDSHCGRKPSKRPGETPDCDLTEARQFNLMFETSVGALVGESSKAYLRPETAQGIFINFKNVLQLARRRPPFGIAQVGKSFRNEITPGNFLFRLREFEQMEMEFFVPPDDAERWHAYWIDARLAWYRALGLRESHLRVREHGPDERSHYSLATSDIEYLYPIGWQELEGVANRGDYDLRQHSEASGTKLEYVDPDGSRYMPFVIEPAVSIDRILLALLVDAYDEEVVEERQRTLLRFHPAVAPVKAAILPLISKESAGMVEPGAQALRGAPPSPPRGVRRRREHRAPLSPPGRDRDAVGLHDRRRDARGRDGHGARPRHARAGAAPARGRPRLARRRARAALGAAAAGLAFALGGKKPADPTVLLASVPWTRLPVRERAPGRARSSFQLASVRRRSRVVLVRRRDHAEGLACGAFRQPASCASASGRCSRPSIPSRPLTRERQRPVRAVGADRAPGTRRVAGEPCLGAAVGAAGHVWQVAGEPEQLELDESTSGSACGRPRRARARPAARGKRASARKARSFASCSGNRRSIASAATRPDVEPVRLLAACVVGAEQRHAGDRLQVAAALVRAAARRG